MNETVMISVRDRTLTIEQDDLCKLEGRSIYLDGKGYPSIWLNGKNVRVHRFIMDAPDGVEVDHRDGNPLNASRGNLRFCTRSENMRNRGLRSTNRSGYKGVCWHTQLKKWRAYLVVDGRQINLGLHDSAEFAARAHDRSAVEHHGEYAYLNFPEDKD